jgi:hypothetical protein
MLDIVSMVALINWFISITHKKTALHILGETDFQDLTKPGSKDQGANKDVHNGFGSRLLV